MNIKKGKITEDAQEWLVACLDPYHDNQLRLEGLPDMVSAPSVVKMHNQSYTLTAPVNAVADWDATVAFTGCNSEIGLTPTLVQQGASIDFLSGYDHAALSTGNPFGSFIVKAGIAGADMTYGSIVVNSTNVAFGASQVAPNSDRCRIIGVAFELTNTTAEIYKQGSLTVGMLPSAVGDYGTVAHVDSNAAPWPTYTSQSWYSAKFAANRDALIGIPGSCTWPAKDGCYVIPRMITHTMPVDAPAFNKRSAVVQSSASDSLYHVTTPTAQVAGWPQFQGVSASGFSAVQVFLTGLSHESTITLTMRTMVEYFPSFNSGLLMLTTPSPPFCPAAFELYSRTAQVAPYAVPVKQNGAGEYFRKILAIVGSIGSSLAPFAGPYSTPVAAVASSASAAARYLKRREEAKKEQKKGGLRIRRDEAGARASPFRK